MKSMQKSQQDLMVNYFSLDKDRKGTELSPSDFVGTSNIPLTRLSLPVRIVIQREL